MIKDLLLLTSELLICYLQRSEVAGLKKVCVCVCVCVCVWWEWGAGWGLGWGGWETARGRERRPKRKGEGGGERKRRGWEWCSSQEVPRIKDSGSTTDLNSLVHIFSIYRAAQLIYNH